MRKAKLFINDNFQMILTFWALGLTGLILWGFHDIRAQTDRIQKSRLESCERGYEGTRSVFKPFFPDDPKKYTKDQKQFQVIIDRLKAHCAVQVNVKTVTNP